MNNKDQRRSAETQRKSTPSPRSLIPNPYFIALLFITLLSAILHFYKLNQLPPGMWFDEAWSAVAARDTAVQGIFPVYYAASFGGMHPAIVYLTRFANLFSDGHPLTIRYAVAVVGTLSTVLAFFAYRAIFELETCAEPCRSIGDWRLTPSPQHAITHHASRITPLSFLAALILTITFPFLLFTRMGFESSLVTPASLILFWGFARALQKNKTRWFIFTGLILGLTIYSFDTARFLPFAITIAYWGIAFLHCRAHGWRHHLLNFSALTLSAIIVFIPLGTYYLRNWDQFTARAGITTYNTLGPGADSVLLAILNNVWRTLSGLILPSFGDVIARHNLPGRPVYDPFLAILFILGLITLLRFWKRPFAIILISWATVMLIPVILTDSAPTYTRIFGAIPALAAIAALCLDTLSRLTHHASKNNKQQLTRNKKQGTSFSSFILHPSSLTILLLTLSLITTTHDYFNKWANLPQLFDDFQVADWETAVFAQEQLATNIVYLAPNQIDEAHPTFDLVLHDANIRTFPANCLVLQSNSEQPILYIIKNSKNLQALTQLKEIYPHGGLAKEIISPITGEKLYSVYNTKHLTDNKQQGTGNNQQTIAQFGDSIELLSSAPQHPIPSSTNPQSPILRQAQDGISIPLTWQATNTPSQDHTYFIHLYRAGAENEAPVAQLDQQPCLPTSQWHEGEIVLETAVLNLPPDIPTGNYTLGLGWYTWPTFERLPLTTSQQPLADERHLLGQITIK